MEVHIWHGHNRFSLRDALYPDEVEYIDDDDEQEDIDSYSGKEDEDTDMIDLESELEGDDDNEWKPKSSSRKTMKVKPRKDIKKIQVVVTSYGVLASEHAKHEKSVRKSGASVFESTSPISAWIRGADSHDQSNGSELSWMKPITVSPAPARPPKRSAR